MKLELKHLSPYLPYGLKGITQNRTVQIQGFELGRELPLIWDEDKEKGFTGRCGFGFKPILRPLSDLTKKIEHNGEKFVPIEIIGKLYVESGSFSEGLFGWDLPIGGDDYQDYYFNIIFSYNVLRLETWCGEPNEGGSYVIEDHALDYPAYNQLFEWHFDVFGLIDNNLAIDINTL